METTLYYIFSTIPQVVAGAIALLGAFVLFKIQFINRDLDEIMMKVYKAMLGNIEMGNLWYYVESRDHGCGPVIGDIYSLVQSFLVEVVRVLVIELNFLVNPLTKDRFLIILLNRFRNIDKYLR